MKKSSHEQVKDREKVGPKWLLIPSTAKFCTDAAGIVANAP